MGKEGLMAGDSSYKKGLKIIVNSRRISWREIDKEVVVLDKKEKEFYELNKSASIIWKELAQKGSVSGAVRKVKSKYKNEDKAQIEKDVNNFARSLIKKGFFIEK